MVQVATITIQADVDAEILFTYSNDVVKSNATSKFNSTNETLVENGQTGTDVYAMSATGIVDSSSLTSDPTLAQVYGADSSALALHIGYSTTVTSTPALSAETGTNFYGIKTPTGITEITDSTHVYYKGADTENTYSSYINTTAGAEVTVYLYAWVTWTSDYYTATNPIDGVV